jgi:multiple sugar transport system substrate-binding protein
MWSGGGELSADSQEPGKIPAPTLVNEGAIAALQFWRNLIKDGSAVLSLPERGFEMDGFVSGKVAMQLTGPDARTTQSYWGGFWCFPIPAGVRHATGIGARICLFSNDTKTGASSVEVC